MLSNDNLEQEKAIVVKNLYKHFKVFYDKGSQLKEKILFWKRNRYEIRTVLDGISFDVRKGEAIGLIGKNGCGKSTTLKLLTKILYPDSGSVKMNGRVSSLIELGAGFHPDMSGRENIYTNASIFGLTRKEIDARLDDIIRFSELEEFIDNPVRTYSSGMYMRLAFSVAINVDADILLIDEILAVGDANFQAKCFNKLREIKGQGTTIVIVSHSLGQIEQICERSIWIKDGKIEMEGKPQDVHLAYMDYMNGSRKDRVNKEKKEESPEVHNENRYGNGDVKIENIKLLDENENEQSVFQTGEKIIISFDIKTKKNVEDADVGIGIFRIDGLQCYGTNTRIDCLEKFDITKDGKVKVVLYNVALLPAQYWLDLAIQTVDGSPVDFYKKVTNFEIVTNINDVGIFRMNHEWELHV